MSATSRRPSTEDYRPPSTMEEPPGIPVLRGAFPVNLLVRLPRNGGSLGREQIAAAGHVDSKISTEHVRWFAERGKLWLQDAGSRNGTFVGGQRLPPGERVELMDGSVVRLGTTLFVFRSSHREGEEAAKALGNLVGLWGLGALRAAVARLRPGTADNVLIEGATGVGKELLAPVVAEVLGRARRPFGAVNVAALPESMFEGQLFGWEKGAFSGSVATSKGVFREYDGGTVFLDEIGELPASLQPKLLRLLQDRDVLTIGAQRPARVDLLVIGATNRDLTAMVESSDFRADLLARFQVCLSIPALEERVEDLYAIAAELWRRRFGPLDLSRVRVDVEAVERMMLHDWPTNVREVDRLLATVDPAAGLKLSTVAAFLGSRGPVSAPVLTREAVASALAECKGNQSEAARRLGVKRPKLRREMKRHGIVG